MKYNHIKLLAGHIRLYDKEGNCLEDIPATTEFLEDAVYRIYGHTRETKMKKKPMRIIIEQDEEGIFTKKQIAEALRKNQEG